MILWQMKSSEDISFWSCVCQVCEATLQLSISSEISNLCPGKVYYSPVSAAWALVTTRFYYFNALLTQLPAVLLQGFSFIWNAAVCFFAEVSNCVCFAVTLTDCLEVVPLFFADLTGYATCLCFSLSLVLWDLYSRNLRTVKMLKLYASRRKNIYIFVPSWKLFFLQQLPWCIFSTLCLLYSFPSFDIEACCIMSCWKKYIRFKCKTYILFTPYAISKWGAINMNSLLAIMAV